MICYGTIRLEGELVNNSPNTINVELNGVLTLTDNSQLVNYGIVNVATCYMSSQMDIGTIIGNFIVENNLFVNASIPEIL